jgi:hypothetical protein
MQTVARTYKDEKGSATAIVLMVMALVSMVGVAATKTTTTELQIATNDQIHKIAFYAAEAARAYVAFNSDLYGSGNIEAGNPVDFPDDTDDTVREPVALASAQSFNGEVEYLNSSAPPRGSGYQVGKFRAHIYEMTCDGYGPRNSESRIQAGFYRIGF